MNTSEGPVEVLCASCRHDFAAHTAATYGDIPRCLVIVGPALATRPCGCTKFVDPRAPTPEQAAPPTDAMRAAFHTTIRAAAPVGERPVLTGKTFVGIVPNEDGSLESYQHGGRPDEVAISEWCNGLFIEMREALAELREVAASCPNCCNTVELERADAVLQRTAK